MTSRHPSEKVDTAELEAIGNAWVASVQNDLRDDSRAAVGGWPGTVREARQRTTAHFVVPLTPAALDEAARIVYGHARTRWLATARSEDAGDA
jgi:hypothetical protein